jgi:two-component system chemotaxis sensor kinase CheA
MSEAEGIDAEFLAEGHAIVESLSRDLVLLSHEHEAGRSTSELLDAALGGFVTLNSLAGLCGVAPIVRLASPTAELLGRLRAGRLALVDAHLDLLSDGVEAIGRQLAAPRHAHLDAASEAYLGRLHALLTEGPRSAFGSLPRTVAVDLALLDRLLELAGELEGTHAAAIQAARRLGERDDPASGGAGLRHAERQWTRQLAALRGSLLDARRVPLSETFEALAEAARGAARDVGVELRVVVEGGQTSVDARVVEELRAPLLELVRDAVRRAPHDRAFTLQATQRGGQVSVTLLGDGLGGGPEPLGTPSWEPERLGAPAAPDDATPAPPQPSNIVPRASGAPRTPPSGLVEVQAGLARLGGALDLDRVEGVTRLTVTVPVALACVRSLLVAAGGETFAVPIAAIEEARFFDPAGLRRLDGREWVVARGEALPIARLAALLGLGARETLPRSGPARHGFVVVLQVGRRRLGLVVDRLAGQHDLLPKPLGPPLEGVRCFRGAAVLGGREIVLVLDPVVLLDEAAAEGARPTPERLPP